MKRAIFLSTSILAAAALAPADDAGAVGIPISDEALVNEEARVESVKQSFFQIGKAALAAELEPLRNWGERTLSQEAGLVAGTIDRAGTALLTHIMNALHPYGMDQAVQIAAAKAAEDAAALEAANQQHAASVALEANGGRPLAETVANVVGDVVDALDPAAAPLVAAGEAVIDPLLAGSPSGSSSETLTGSSSSPSDTAGSPANGGEGPLGGGVAPTPSAEASSPVTSSPTAPAALTDNDPSVRSGENPTSNSSSFAPDGDQPELQFPSDPTPAVSEPASPPSDDQPQG